MKDDTLNDNHRKDNPTSPKNPNPQGGDWALSNNPSFEAEDSSEDDLSSADEESLEDENQVISLFDTFRAHLEEGEVRDVQMLAAIWPTLLHAPDLDGWTPLHVVANSGHLPLVNILLKHGAQVGQPDHSGRLPLYYAARSGQTAACLRLLELMHAEEGSAPGSGIAETFGRLIDDGEIDGSDELYGVGYVLDSSDASGATALHYAARFSQEKRVRELLAWNASPNMQDRAGDTPLHWAVAGLGLPHPGPLEAATPRGCWRDVIRLLIEEDADTQLCNKRGLTPYELAQETHQYEVMDWIGVL